MLVAVPPPGGDARPLPAWGIYARNVKNLDLENIRLGLDQQDARPIVVADRIGTLTLDALHFPPTSATPMLLTNVGHVRFGDMPLEWKTGKQ